ncbi:hypothetical protein D9756_000913 [Leucocoprinus leucothites]|uniref:Mediator of RNA polymerase II transcription subunit 13 n=1 Tax=Leucocoprinus leucothites TaxID=201217 RepID=A0A8H5LNF6_9AGAR|nr:hypothetical protein D9756_000913 [Leucoagaricus leucothites]
MLVSSLLAAAITVAQESAVAAAQLVPDAPASSLPDVLDSARRHLASSRDIQDALLPSVQLGSRPALYVFSIVPATRIQAAVAAMDALRFDRLVAPAPASHFPFQKINEQPRHIISHFLSGLRTRLIDNIVASSTGVQRFKDGFLISHQQLTPGTDWGSGWEYKALSRPLIFCHIQLQPTPSAILIRPTLFATTYLPLHSSLPLLPRSPILLLPYGTPAYFLTTYSGPTSALQRQFADSLQGHGQPSLDSSFIIGWISVENRQGEDKGITFIYPTRLCLAFAPALNRSLLDYTPDLPGPLQPSPKLLSASTPQSECPPIVYPHRPSLLGSPTTELKAFRALTLSKSKNIQTIAAQVSSYVDSVAKDRERERERLKREREGHSPNLVARTTPSAASNVIPQNTSGPPPPLAVHTPTPTPTSMPTQNFYPSPPQADTTTVPTLTGNTSPVLPAVTPQPAVSVPPPSAPPAPPPSTSGAGPSQVPPPMTSSSNSSSSSYDPFGYLMSDMGMDFGMDFDMGMSMNLGRNSSSSSTGAAGAGTSNRSGYHDDGTSRGMNLGGSSGMEFEDFTDDDFSFFDRPSTNNVPAPPPLPSVSQQQPHPAGGIGHQIPNTLQVTSPPLFGEVHLSGPGPPNATPHSQPTPLHTGGPWSAAYPEGFTPRSVEHMDSVIPQSDLFSSATPSGGPKTPFSAVNNNDGVPRTPNVHLDHHVLSDVTMMQDRVESELEKRGGGGRGFFDPIPFAKYHRVSDNKYAPRGKFGLPSPPPDDEPEVPVLPAKPPLLGARRRSSPSILRSFSAIQSPEANPANASASSTWRPRYDAITDPRVGVMRKLIGVKRKLALQGGRSGKDIRTSPWGMGLDERDEEWVVHRSLSVSKDLESEVSGDEGEESQSDDDGGSDMDGEEGDDGEGEEGTPAISRPNTPPPTYLPLGPALLHTQFDHAYLLPLSKPLRPPGSSSGNINGGHAVGGVGMGGGIIVNVPTPVSPAAGLGLSAEKWRALEVVINVLAREAVENVVWRDTWVVVNNVIDFGVRGGDERGVVAGWGGGGGSSGRKLTEVWVSDVKLVQKVLAGLEGVNAGLGLGDVFGLDSAIDSETKPQGSQLLTPPKVSVGKGDAIITVLPPALRFWEKLGLGPKSGEKDGAVFVLFADDGEQQHRQAEVASWLAGVCTAYETKHLGRLKLGKNTYCSQSGLVPLRFDSSFRKHFAAFASGLNNVSTPILLFLVVPITLMSLSSTTFRQMLSAIQKSLKSFPENRVTLQLVPEHTINYIENDPGSTNQLESFCINVYNRILVPVHQPLGRIFQPDNTPLDVKAYLQKPIFTLARPVYGKVTYTRSVHASLDVLDRWTLLHVGYRMSRCGRWVVIACCDQRGEVWDQAVWLVKGGGGGEQQDGDGEGSSIGTGGAGNSVGSGAGSGASVMAGAAGGVSQEEMVVVKKVWEFVAAFARRADVEWRIVISKLGVMDEAELTAWTNYLPLALPTSGLGAVHVSLVCADPDSPWLFTKFNPKDLGAVPHQQPSSTTNHKHQGATSTSSNTAKNNIFSDASSTTYALYPNIVLPMATPPTQSDIRLTLPYVADPSSISNGMGDGDSESAATSPTAVSVGVPNSTTTPVSPSTGDSSPVASGSTMPHPVGLTPRSTTCLVRVPRAAPMTSISMLHIHVLATYCYPASLVRKSSSANTTAPLELRNVHGDVTRNFYELSVLAQARWRMSAPEVGSGGGTGVVAGGCFGNGAGAGVGSGMGVNPILPMHLAMVDIMGQVTDGVDGVEIDS